MTHKIAFKNARIIKWNEVVRNRKPFYSTAVNEHRPLAVRNIDISRLKPPGHSGTSQRHSEQTVSKYSVRKNLE